MNTTSSPPPSQSPTLPELRQEVLLHPGPRNHDGSPSWILEDPGRDLFFQIGWTEAEMLARWHMGTASDIVDSINEATALSVDSDLVENFVRFLAHNSLTRDPNAVARYRHEVNTRFNQPLGKSLLQNYLFFRIPIFRPDPFLARTLPIVERLFFNRLFFLLTVAAGVLGIFLASRQWDTFRNTFLHFFTLEGAVLFALTLTVTKTFHELGHAYAAKRLGCRIPSMGVAFMVMMPLLYTDTSTAWRLRKRSQRMQVCAAGIITETALAAWATLTWSFLPDGPLRSAAFILATTTWIMTLAINLSPLMRFDGYFLLSDALNVPNMQPRAFALARWKIREWLFAFGDQRPEQFEVWRERTLIFYAFSTWIYRFTLFLGIALIVYHKFFKILGIVLFLVEIITFIAAPVFREMKTWIIRLKDQGFNFRSAAFVVAGTALLGLLFIPWSSNVTAPALLQSERQVRIYSPVGSQVVAIHAVTGQTVQEGMPLFELRVPELQQEITMLRKQAEALQWQLSFHFINRDTAASIPVVQRERKATLNRLALLKRQKKQLVIRAPVNGRIVDMATPLSEDEWIGTGEWLCTAADPTAPHAVAYVNERDLHRLRLGCSARFIPEDPGQWGIDMNVTHIAYMASRHLGAVPELASSNGGAIAAMRAPTKVTSSLGADAGAWIPEQAVYRVLLRPSGNREMLPQVLRGSVIITADGESLFTRIRRYVLAVFVREASF